MFPIQHSTFGVLRSAFLIFLLSTPYSLLKAEISYQKDIAPIFADNCLKCHGPEKQKSALRLDDRPLMLKGGDSGLPTIVPGKPEKSFLLEVISDPDHEQAMPPKGDRLTEKQINTLTTWIQEGAHWPGQMDKTLELKTDHWSLQQVKRPALPTRKESGRPAPSSTKPTSTPATQPKNSNIQDSTFDVRSSHPIDAFLNQALSKAELTPNKKADPRTLIRRASIILTGLPPTADRIEKFLTDYKNSPSAYPALIDELLASPHFGERWAQHWLDVIRWAETNGSEANLYRKNAWIYRDYVIRSFNEDLPYDQFIHQQLAGDTMGAGDATGFLVAGPHVPAATVGAEPTAIRQARADRMDEVMQTVGASMLGMTVSCARCHNHKFDPISIQDYYSLTAVFQDVEFGGRYPELADTHPRKKRAKELYPQLFKERKTLREAGLAWAENWGGFQDYIFPEQTTKALRIDFTNPAIWIDELEIFGPERKEQGHPAPVATKQKRKKPINHALASNGATLKTDPAMTQGRGELHHANDGYYGTMQWRSKAPKNSPEKPWLEIHFPDPKKINRLRTSSNREYYFETDYILNGQGKKLTAYNPPNFKISILKEDGTWQQISHSQHAKNRLNQNPEHKAAHDRLHTLIGKMSEEGPRHAFITRFIKPVITKVLHRGSPENPRDEVPPAGFEILKGDLGLTSKTPGPERRKKFAQWLTNPDHPLTSRVMVNRLWHHTFGTGIVPTTSDFGIAGAKPTHPELLDWLAAEFIKPSQPGAKPWSTKSLLKLLLTSEAFQRSSTPSSLALQKDANSALLWRYPPRRVEAEVIRDSILQASGKLDRTLGGKSFRIHNEKKTYAQWQVINNHGPETWRRMIYQERMRRVDDQIFTAFDFPDCGQVRAKRPISTTPLQALNLLNSPFVIDQSNHIAQRAQKEAPDSPRQHLFTLLLKRPPTEEERKTTQNLPLHLLARTLINSNEFAFLP